MRSLSLFRRTAVAGIVACALAITGCGSECDSPPADVGLDQALPAFVGQPDGPPGAVVVVQRDSMVDVYTAGVADVATQAPIQVDDYMRLASVAKAFSGAAALAVVAGQALSLDDTVGRWLPSLPASWAPVTLRQLLGHTSGIADFSKEKKFAEAVAASLLVAPPPIELLSFLCSEPATFTGCKPPTFTPGTRYRYSNSDNILVALMIEAATGAAYEQVLVTRVYGPLALSNTSLPSGAAMPTPLLHGYQFDTGAAPDDVSELFAAGWAWASGGIVSTPADATRFVRGYVSGGTIDAATRAAQFTFVPGESEPPGPGVNAAGLALFRYQTRCGTVYGHTGNTAGYTQFVAATGDGRRSVTVSVNAQLTPNSRPERFAELRRIYELGVCTALD